MVDRINQAAQFNTADSRKIDPTIRPSDRVDPQDSPKRVSNNSEKDFWDQAKSFFSQAVEVFSIIFGISKPNNEPYIKLVNKLKDKETGARNKVLQRANFLFEESQRVLEHGAAQIEQGKKPWEGLPEDIGVQMSGRLTSLAGNTSEQRYYHNCAVNYWAGVELGQYSKAISVDDHDNTWVNKNWDPSDTGLVQSLEALHWGRMLFEIGRDELGVQEWINTARAPFPTIIQLVPEGLKRYFTIGLLQGPLQERFGLSSEDQLTALEDCALIALNSTVIQKPDEPLYLSQKIIREAKLLELLEGPEGPRFDGKTFVQSIRDLVNKNGLSVFETKALPRYVLDTYNTFNEMHLQSYLKIVELKKKFVDDTQDKDPKKTWSAFAEEVCKDVEAGNGAWGNLERLREQDTPQDKLKEARKEAYRHIRLYGGPGSEYARSQNGASFDYWQLIDKSSSAFNPQAFYERVTAGVLVAPVVHFYNNHGTPVDNGINGILEILEKFGNDPKVRREVAKLNCSRAVTKDLHRDIRSFRDTGVETFVNEGPKKYLEWRILKYLEFHFKKEKLGEFELEGGEKVFNLEGNLKFSQAFRDHYKLDKISDEEYLNLFKNDLSKDGISFGAIPQVIDTFLPEQGLAVAQQVFSDTLPDRDNLKEVLQRLDFFYPNELFVINSTIPYTNSYVYNSIFNLVLKRNDLDSHGQYYWELQPAREKYQGIPSFGEVMNSNLSVHTAGDSKSDIGMMASALERGGAASVAFNLIQNDGIYREIIKLRRGDGYKEFKDLEPNTRKKLFERYRERSNSFYFLKVEKDKLCKVIGFDDEGKEIFKTNDSTEPVLFTEEEIISELKAEYESRIIRNVSPEAYVRRRAEIFGLLSGQDIEFHVEELQEAKRLYEERKAGKTLSQAEQIKLGHYEWAIIAEKEGTVLPEEAPRFDIYREWQGKDKEGHFVVYRSKSADGALVKDRLNGDGPILFDESVEDLSKLRCLTIKRDGAKYVYINDQGNQLEEEVDLERLNDCVVENELISPPSPVEGIFANEFLLKVFGKEKLNKFVRSLPLLFNGLLKYSGAIMAVGGVTRLVSKLFGSTGEPLYKLGYWMSNGLRAVSALGGALRGELNVHKYHNIALGEIVNVISSFLPNGVKHLGLGLGNFVLFLGRGQYRAQSQQRVNNHTERELKEGKLLNIDPRKAVRNVTELGTGVIRTVMQYLNEKGMKPLVSELAGNLVSAVVTPIQMLKDIKEDKKIVTELIPRIAEKCGTYYKSVPSAGHLLTLVGILSGVGTAVAGTLGRIGHNKAEDGFNFLGKMAISFANAIPALGIYFNAKEVMANPNGLPRMYRDSRGKDSTYDPKKAGLAQMASSYGFGAVPWLGLHNKGVAALFDVINGLYFLGAAEEEKPNTNMLTRSILRQSHEFYTDPRKNYQLVDF